VTLEQQDREGIRRCLLRPEQVRIDGSRAFIRLRGMTCGDYLRGKSEKGEHRNGQRNTLVMSQFIVCFDGRCNYGARSYIWKMAAIPIIIRLKLSKSYPFQMESIMFEDSLIKLFVSLETCKSQLFSKFFCPVIKIHISLIKWNSFFAITSNEKFAKRLPISNAQ
jgi:hypothetical protein